MKCPYCSAAQGRCATTSTGRSITECGSCGRVIAERQCQNHHLFHIRAQDTPLCLVTSDLPSIPQPQQNDGVDKDPFQPTGFITAFSAWSLEPSPLFLRSSHSFSGQLAELERTFELLSSSTTSTSSSVMMDNLRAYLQIIDVASILGLDYDICDHAFQLFRDCCSATCLRNRSVEALATAALVQAIREAQEPRTLQVLSSPFAVQLGVGVSIFVRVREFSSTGLEFVIRTEIISIRLDSGYKFRMNLIYDPNLINLFSQIPLKKIN